MRKGLTEVVFILDRSGSMRGLEEDTIGGFNSMIEKQRKEEGEEEEINLKNGIEGVLSVSHEGWDLCVKDCCRG